MSTLKTTLPDSVTDESIPKIDEFVINVKSSSSWVQNAQLLALTRNGATLRIVGDGYFTDSTGTENLGKTLTLNTGTGLQYLYVSNGDYKLFVGGGKDFYSMQLAGTQAIGAYKSAFELDLDSMLYFKSTFLAIRLSSFVGSLENFFRTFRSISELNEIFLYGTTPRVTYQDIANYLFLNGRISGSVLVKGYSDYTALRIYFTAEGWSLETP